MRRHTRLNCCCEQQRRCSSTTMVAVCFALVVEYVVQLPQFFYACPASMDECTEQRVLRCLCPWVSAVSYFAPAPVLEYIAPAASRVAVPLSWSTSYQLLQCFKLLLRPRMSALLLLSASRSRPQWTLHLQRSLKTLRLSQLCPTRCLLCPLRRLLCS